MPYGLLAEAVKPQRFPGGDVLNATFIEHLNGTLRERLDWLA